MTLREEVITLSEDTETIGARTIPFDTFINSNFLKNILKHEVLENVAHVRIINGYNSVIVTPDKTRFYNGFAVDKKPRHKTAVNEVNNANLKVTLKKLQYNSITGTKYVLEFTGDGVNEKYYLDRTEAGKLDKLGSFEFK